MANKIKAGMLKHPNDPSAVKVKTQHRPLTPWEKGIGSTTLSKNTISESLRKMTLGELRKLSEMGARFTE